MARAEAWLSETMNDTPGKSWFCAGVLSRGAWLEDR
jgi:hypothetical protein